MKKGFALITVLAVLIMIAIGITTILTSVGSHTTMKSNNVKELKAQYLAEAGMQRALWRCRTSANSCVAANEEFPEEGSTITTTATLQPDGMTYKIFVVVNYPNV